MMLLVFLIRVAGSPPVRERAIHSANLLCVSCVNVYQCVCVCVCAFFSFCFEGRIWDLIY